MLDERSLRLSRNNIARALEIRGKSSFEASEALGRNRTYIDDYLKGRKASLAASFIEALASFLDLADRFIEGKDELGDTISYIESKKHSEKFQEFFMKAIVGEDQEDSSVMQEAERRWLELGRPIQVLRQQEGERVFYKAERSDEMIEAFVRQDEWRFPAHFVEAGLNASADDLKVFPILDTSMNGQNGYGYHIGDYVVVDLSRRDMLNGGIFCLMIGPNVLFRRVSPLQGANGRFVCRPLNSEFSSFEMPYDGAKSDFLGRVVAHIRRT